MANRIRGITVEIGGDTTKLQKALSGVDKSLKTTETNLKDINRLLKLDPGNTELLTQKQKNLKDAVTNTKDRLDKLKEAQDQVGRGTDEWDALQREIIDTEQKLKSAEEELKDFGSVGKQQLKVVSEKVQAAGKDIQDFGAGVTKHVSAPMAALAGVSIAAFKDVDEGFDTVTKKTGATGEALEGLQEIVKNLATSIPTDFQTAGEAVGEVNTRFGLTGQALEDLSAKFIKFAELNDTDVSSSIDSVQAAMAAFNMDAEDAGDMLDMLNKAGQDTGVSVDKLAQDLVANQTALQEMGLSVEDSIGLLASFDKSGIDSSDVLGGLKKALQNATKEGTPMKKALVDLEKDMKLATTDTDAMQAAMELFGNKAGPAIAKAVDEGKLSLTDFSDHLDNWSGSVDNTFEETLDPIDKFQTTLNDMKITGAELGATLLETLQPILEKVAEVMQTLREKWESLSPETQDAIAKAIMIAAVVGPIITIVGGLVAAIGALLSPIGLVVAAIAGVIAIGVALYQNWDKIKAKAIEIKDKISNKWKEMKETVGGAVDQLKEKVTTQWEALKTGVTTAATTVSTWVTEKWSNMKESVTTTMTNFKTGITTIWSNIKTGITEKASSIATSVSDKFQSIKTSISDKLGSAKTKALEIFGNIKSGISEKLESAKETISNIIEKIKGFFSFNISWPKIPMPHFSIQPEGWKIGDLLKGSIPHLGIDWYKKAYDQPYLFTQPTVVAGRGFGDGGGSGEMVYGRDQLLRDIALAKGNETTINIYASPGMDVNQLADQVQDRLAFLQRQRERAYA